MMEKFRMCERSTIGIESISIWRRKYTSSEPKCADQRQRHAVWADRVNNRTAVEPSWTEWCDEPMSSPSESVFELSLSEKLQLVEDLWDDIASTPEDVLVHDWHKEELARRKQNLLSSHGSSL